VVDGLGDERAGAYTCANQALITRLHNTVAIATKTRADQKADAITYPGDFSRYVLKRIRSFLKTLTAAMKAMAA
jgi:hypothetical protein